VIREQAGLEGFEEVTAQTLQRHRQVALSLHLQQARDLFIALGVSTRQAPIPPRWPRPWRKQRRDGRPCKSPFPVSPPMKRIGGGSR
jgi:hypothetical protein